MQQPPSTPDASSHPPTARLYRVEVQGASYDVILEGAGIRIGDRTYAVSFAATPGGYSLVVDGRSYQVQGRTNDEGAVEVTVDGVYSVARARNERALLLEQYGAGDTSKKTELDVRAPMPGLVVKVLVEAGAAVRRGQGLAILEAMKMENELRAPQDGTVHRIHVRSGEAVQKNQLLIELE